MLSNNGRYEVLFFQAYRSKQKGSNYRKQLAGKSTTLLLFHGEAETAPHQLHLSGKSYEDVGERQKRRKRAEIKSSVNLYLAPLANAGLKATGLQLETKKR